MKMLKTSVREQAKQKRLAMTKESKQKSDSMICSKVLDLLKRMNVCQVLCYVSSYAAEISTIHVIQTLLAEGTEIAVPKCIGDGNDMKFYVIHSLDDLERCRFNILEPDTEKCSEVIVSENSVCIVPGLAFDKNRQRVGFGKGYYDKFLSGYSGITIGLCCDCCMYENVPAEQHDRPVDILVTESSVYVSDDKRIKEESFL